ncbi:MAG: ThuA domain-containing protein [Clostridia bacterium]|nr:ThuA domain-containing protein [Clostridia bacterium]MBR6810744.1 ThuA domain-containing protein [Clostridia bacterium]
MAIRITVWNEDNVQESSADVLKVYPEGLVGAVADMFKGEQFQVRKAWLSQEEAGLTEEILADTDVLIWWGHCKHGQVPDEIVSRVQGHVLRGMGLIVLHSGHESKIFQWLMGTQCSLRWHEMNEKERIFVIEPNHPIMWGLPLHFELEAEEMYGERFDIPAPDKLLAIGWYQSGEVFRSACLFDRGYGKVFYFQPGHETLPSYHNPYVKQVIVNAAYFIARNRALDRPLHSEFAEALEQF